MGRHVQDLGIVPEERLGPVAVVDVPVDDQHPLPGRHQGGGGHGDIVDQAEAHRPVGQGMVARRPGGHKAGAVAPLTQHLDGHQSGAR